MDITDLSFFKSFILIIIITIALALAGLFVCQKVFKFYLLKLEEIRIGSTICTLIGGLFGLLLALIVITLWQDYKDMQAKTIEEATYLDIVYREASNLPPQQRLEFQKMLEEYISIIINESWPKMTKGIESKKAMQAYDELNSYILKLEIKEMNIDQELLKGNLIDNLNKLAIYRKERWFYASTPRVPANMWVMIYLGAFISICCTYFFKIGSFKIQAIFTTMHSCMIGIILYLITTLNYPFRGAIKIEPDSFVKLLDLIKESNAQ